MQQPNARVLKSKPAVALNVDPNQRRHMIAEAAYFLAEHRGFRGGDPIQDWLSAEVEIDYLIATDEARTPEETAAYLLLREEVRKAFAQVQDTVDAAALKSAYERSLAEVKRLETISTEALQKLAAALREEMMRTNERLGPSWEHFSERSAGLFSVWQHRGRSFLDRAANEVRHWLHREGQGPEH